MGIFSFPEAIAVKITSMKLWKLIQKMPEPVRYFCIRRIFTFSYELPEGITFKIAETAEEMEQAFRIIHDGYVERKLMDESSSKLRITKYFALPTTSVIVCKYHNKVVATASVIQDSQFRLPTDEFRDLDQFRKKDLKLVEVSGLAIDKSWRHQNGKLMIPLSKYMWEYVHYCLKADAIVISTAAFAKDFYRGLFLFEPLDDDKVISFKTVKNSKTVSQILFLKPFLERLEKTYKNEPKERSLWALSKHVYPGFKYPERKYHFATDTVMSPKDLNYFFKEKSDILKGLNEKEKMILAELYFFDSYRNVIFGHEEAFHSGRKDLRNQVVCKSNVGEVREVSRGGLKLVTSKREMDIGHNFNLEIQINATEKVSVATKVKWKNGSEVGLQIVKKNECWDQFIDVAEDRHPARRTA